MDQSVMAKALQSVLGEGYEASSRTTGLGSTSKTPSPHDFLQGRVAKDATGADMHVPQPMSNQPPKLRTKVSRPKGAGGRLQPVAKAKPTEDQVTHGLLTAGAAGGLLSLPTLARETRHKVGMLKDPGVMGAANDAVKAAKGVGKLKPILAHPKAVVGLAGGAAALEGAGLAGDFLGRKVTGQRKQGVMKSLTTDEVPELVTFAKMDDEQQMVFGWCSVSKRADGTVVVDLQGDEVPIEEIEKSAYDYMLYSRKGGNQHARTADDQPVHIGDCVESMVFTPDKFEALGLPEDFTQGWWYGMKIHDPADWAEVKSGKRAGFSIHGKGRREPVSKATVKQDVQQVVDRKEQIKDIALGTAGATAAGAGGASTVVPWAAKHGIGDAVKAERLSGRLKVIGAVTGGTAGVYGGIHAAHQAAKNAPLKPIRRKTKVAKDWDEDPRSGQAQEWSPDHSHSIPKPHEAAQYNAWAKKKAKEGGTHYNTPKPVVHPTSGWSPVVNRKSSESRRQRRAKGYEAGAALGSAAALGAAGHEGYKAHALNRTKADVGAIKRTHARAAAQEYGGIVGELRAGQREYRAKVAGKANNRGLPQAKAAHLKRQNALGGKLVLQRKDAIKRAQGAVAVAEAGNKRIAGQVLARSRHAGKLGAAGAGLAAVAGAIHHQRKGSWRPYPGTQ